MGGNPQFDFLKKIETYMPFYFLGVSFNKCKEVTGKLISVRLMGKKHRAGTSGRTVLI